MVSSFALLLAATGPSPTAGEIMAAHRARTSVAALEAREAVERARLCANRRGVSDDEVIVCGQRDSGAYRVPSSPSLGRAPGDPAERYADAGERMSSRCGIGANLCGKPAIKLFGVPFGRGAGKGPVTGILAGVASLFGGD